MPPDFKARAVEDDVRRRDEPPHHEAVPSANSTATIPATNRSGQRQQIAPHSAADNPSPPATSGIRASHSGPSRPGSGTSATPSTEPSWENTAAERPAMIRISGRRGTRHSVHAAPARPGLALPAQRTGTTTRVRGEKPKDVRTVTNRTSLPARSDTLYARRLRLL